MSQYDVGHYGYDDGGQEIPFISVKSTTGIGLWIGFNGPYHNICIWGPFYMMYIMLPKFLKTKTRNDKQYGFKNFSVSIRPWSFGLYIHSGDFWDVRLPFIDIHIKKRKTGDETWCH